MADPMTDTAALVARLRELEAALKPFAESLVAQTNVEHHSQDWRDETDDTVVSITTSHQRKGMPYLAPDHTLWVGAFRKAREAFDALPQILSAPAPDGEVEAVARAMEDSDAIVRRNAMTWGSIQPVAQETDYTRLARAAIAALPRRDGMREALEKIERGLECNGDAHYCPNCDRSMDGLREIAPAALKGEA